MQPVRPAGETSDAEKVSRAPVPRRARQSTSPQSPPWYSWPIVWAYLPHPINTPHNRYATSIAGISKHGQRAQGQGWRKFFSEIPAGTVVSGISPKKIFGKQKNFFGDTSRDSGRRYQPEKNFLRPLTQARPVLYFLRNRGGGLWWGVVDGASSFERAASVLPCVVYPALPVARRWSLSCDSS